MRDKKDWNQSEKDWNQSGKPSNDHLDLYDDEFAEGGDEIEEGIGTPRSLMLVDQLLYTTHEKRSQAPPPL